MSVNSTSTHKIKIYQCFIIITLVFIFDQVAKSWALNNLALHKVYNMLPFLNFVLVFNKGIAFSLFANSSVFVHSILIASSIAIIIFMIFMLRNIFTSTMLHPIAISLIIGGALGNLSDKLLLGYVIDFIDLFFKGWHFATFNVADAAISIGGVLLLLA